MSTPKDSVKPVSIIADSREGRSSVISRLSSFPGVSIDVKELSSADYVLADGVGVERKSASDFISSIMDSRIFDQVARMKIEYDKVVVLIEGDPYATNSGMAVEAIDGALSWLAMLSGVNTIFSPSVSTTPRILWRMSLHATHGLGYEIPSRSLKPKAPSVLAQYLVEGLPGVGPSVAKNLLSHFKSPAAVFAASIDNLCEVKGIGKKTATGIYESLRISVA